MAKIFVMDFGIRKIRLTGGEPLARKNAGEIIEALSRLPVELAITTNGVLLDRFFPLLKKAGLTSLNISLDSLMPDNFQVITKQDSFYQVFENINRALSLGFHVKVNTVVQRGMNEHELLDFVAWTRHSPIHVRFIEFMPFDGNRWQWGKVVSYREMLEKVTTFFPVEKLDDDRNSTAKSYRVPGHAGTFSVISSVTAAFCDTCNRLRMTADGKLRNCLFSQKETDLLTPFRNGADIRPLVRHSVSQKQAERGGLPGFDHEEAPEAYAHGGCMTAIGG